MSKKYDVCGIGNAIIDLDFEVSTTTLNKLGIAKGVMTLIDEGRELELLENLVGIKHVKASAGSAANTIFTLNQFSNKVFFSGRIGNDPSGDYILKSLTDNKIDTNITANNRPIGTTGKCLVLVTPDADRTMNTFLGVSEKFSVDDISPEAIAASKYLYIEGYLMSSPTARVAALKARQIAADNDTKIALSLSDPNMVKFFKDSFLELIDGKIDLLFCNDHEAKLFCDTASIEETVEALKAYSHQFVVTMGGKGAIIYDGTQSIYIKAFPVPIVDSVGAGDVFAGGFLSAICKGHSAKIAGNFASCAAGKVVSKFGPRLTQTEADWAVSRFSALNQPN